MERAYYVYILASKRNGMLYVGVTNDLMRRVYEHKNHLIEGHSKKYNITRLVWYDQTNYIYNALEFEKKIKNRNRRWRIGLIIRDNPNWSDLAEDWYE